MKTFLCMCDCGWGGAVGFIFNVLCFVVFMLKNKELTKMALIKKEMLLIDIRMERTGLLKSSCLL